MSYSNFDRLFNNLFDSNIGVPAKPKKRKRSRTCRVEELENREMLAVTIGEADFDAISNQYADLNLGAYADYRIIEVSGDGDDADENHFAFTPEGLQAAIDWAAQTDENDLIVIRTAAGEDSITLESAELAINADSAQFGTVSIVSYGTGNLTLDADGESRVISVGNTAEVGLGGLTITGGSTNEGGGILNSGTLTITHSDISGNTVTGDGGGIRSEGASLTITHSTISNNTATGFGGGIDLDPGTTTVTITGCTISDNSANSGGGIESDAGTITITDTTISNNTTTGAGGGIQSTNAVFVITNSTISNNTASGNGGGINNDGGTMTITGSTISENTTDGQGNYGGGIFNTGTLTITTTTVSNNTAGHDGGGIISRQSSTLTITDSIVSGNRSEVWGGGIYGGGPVGTAAATITITNCQITENHAVGSSGGLYVGGTGTTMTITNSVIAGNTSDTNGGGIFSNPDTILFVINSVVAGNTTAGTGGGLFLFGTTTVTNSTIAGNTAQTANGIFVTNEGTLTLNNSIVAQNAGSDIGHGDDPTLSGRHNLIGDGTGQTAFEDGVDGNIVDADPMFVNLAAGNLRLAEGSSAIDAGDNALAVDADGTALTVDLDGNPRIYNITVDMGAYEFGDTPPPPPGDLDTPTGLHSPAQTMYTITLAWNIVDAATGYEIQYRVAGSELPFSTEIVGAVNTVIIEGLEPATTYEFQIRATDGTDFSAWSASITVTTRTDDSGVTPGIPTGFRSTVQTAGSITLHWNQQSDATGFIIQYRETGTQNWFNLALQPNRGDATSAIANNLKAGTAYQFQICAVNSCLQSAWHPAITVSTYPAVPTGFRSTAETANSITLSWNPQAGVSTYQLQYRAEGATSWQDWTSPAGNATTATVGGLVAGTKYDFRLTARNVSGSNVATTTATTKGSGGSSSTSTNPVKPKVSKSSTLSTITLTWNHNARNAGYTVVCTSHPAITQDQIDVRVSGNTYTATITGLNDSTTYKFSVTASNAEGKTAVTKVSAKTTKYTAPKDIKVVKGTATISTLSLSIPANVMPETDRYDIKVFGPKMKTSGPALATIQLTFAANGTPSVTIDDALSVAVEGNRLVLGGLAMNTKYSFTVQAFSGDVDSAIAKTSGKTLKYTAVKINRVDGKVPEPALSWTAPKNGNPMDYQRFEVAVYLASDKDQMHDLVGSGLVELAGMIGDEIIGNSTQIFGLESGVKYTITVRAISADDADVRSLFAKTSVKMA